MTEQVSSLSSETAGFRKLHFERSWWQITVQKRIRLMASKTSRQGDCKSNSLPGFHVVSNDHKPKLLTSRVGTIVLKFAQHCTRNVLNRHKRRTNYAAARQQGPAKQKLPKAGVLNSPEAFVKCSIWIRSTFLIIEVRLVKSKELFEIQHSLALSVGHAPQRIHSFLRQLLSWTKLE